MAQPGGNVGAQAAGGVAGGAQQPLGRPAVMPEAYEGDGDWEEYLAYFNQCADINGWNDAAKARYLGVRLRGMAQRYHAGIPQARRLNWQQVTQDFTQRFAPAADVRRYKAQFKSRRRGQDEPLPKLADDLRRLVTRAYPNMQDGDQQELVRDQFIDALTPSSLRVRLQENPPATLQEALERALHLERVWFSVEVPQDAASKLVGPYSDVRNGSGLSAAALQPVFAVDDSRSASAERSLERVADELAQLTAQLRESLNVQGQSRGNDYRRSDRAAYRGNSDRRQGQTPSRGSDTSRNDQAAARGSNDRRWQPRPQGRGRYQQAHDSHRGGHANRGQSAASGQSGNRH